MQRALPHQQNRQGACACVCVSVCVCVCVSVCLCDSHSSWFGPVAIAPAPSQRNIQRSLESYNEEIQKLRESMDQSTNSARAIRADILQLNRR